jgi:hypothetical protein
VHTASYLRNANRCANIAALVTTISSTSATSTLDHNTSEDMTWSSFRPRMHDSLSHSRIPPDECRLLCESEWNLARPVNVGADTLGFVDSVPVSARRIVVLGSQTGP